MMITNARDDGTAWVWFTKVVALHFTFFFHNPQSHIFGVLFYSLLLLYFPPLRSTLCILYSRIYHMTDPSLMAFCWFFLDSTFT